MRTRLILLGVLVGLFLAYLAPYYVLVLRLRVLPWNHGMSDVELAQRYRFPLRCERGYAVYREQMRTWYDWWHDIDATLRYEYWHATSVEDLKANH